MRRQVPGSIRGALLLGAWCMALTWAAGRPATGSDEVSQSDTGVAAEGAAAPGPNASFYHPFACRLFRTVGANGGNLVLSPHSISTSLAMVRAGAAGKTARQIDTLLRLPADAPGVYRSIARELAYTSPAYADSPEGDSPEEEAPDFTTLMMLEYMVGTEDDYSLTLANGIFGQRGCEFLEPFRRSVSEDFGAELLEVDFASPAEARSVINRWVEEKTNRRITEIVPAGLPNPEIRMVLADAIHFEASWAWSFPESETVSGPFHVAPGKVVTVQRMRHILHVNYAKTTAAHVLELPYSAGGTAMVIVLPRAKYGLNALVRKLTPGKIRRWNAAMRKRTVVLELPRFAFSSELNLSDALEGMGMTDAFSSDNADFSLITAREPLSIGDMLHQAFVAVDEHGTEAAAASLVVILAGGGSRGEVPLVVDRPFLFLIRHEETGAILFMGRVVDPTAG